jgi:hypothetical protein
MEFFHTHFDLFQEKNYFFLTRDFLYFLTQKLEIRNTEAENTEKLIEYFGLKI